MLDLGITAHCLIIVGQNNNPTCKSLLNKPTDIGCQVSRPGQAAPLSCKMQGRSILKTVKGKTDIAPDQDIVRFLLRVLACSSAVCLSSVGGDSKIWAESGHCNRAHGTIRSHDLLTCIFVAVNLRWSAVSWTKCLPVYFFSPVSSCKAYENDII
jgi:hypothetical protein